MSESQGFSGARTKVLIVDDHDLFVEGLVSLLRDEPDIEVIGAESTIQRGIDAARARRPDVVLMDQALPDGDGVDAARVIKESLPEVRVVMLTQFADETLLATALEVGCAGYITKDRSFAELVAAVRSVADGDAVIPPGLLARVLPRLGKTRVGRRPDLTAREREVLGLLAQGLTVQDISRSLTLSQSTVRNHVQSVLTKLGVHSQLEAVATAVRAGIVRIA